MSRQFVILIAAWAAKSTQSSYSRPQATPEGRKILQEFWPDIANA